MAETMTCGDYQVYVAERGGERLTCRLNASSIRFTRTLNDFSEADINVGFAGCRDCLTSVNPWQHEILIFRDSLLVWCGPIMNISYDPAQGSVAINARDLLAWTEKRFIELDDDYEVEQVDIKEVFEWVLNHGYQKQPWNMSWVISETGVPIDWFYPGKQGDRWGGTYKTVGDELRALSQIGLDYTVISRFLLSGERGTLYLADSNWAQVPQVILSGTQMSTRTAVAGGNGGYYGWYEDQMWVEESDHPWGLLETFVNRSEIDADTTSLPNPITQEAYVRHQILSSPLAFIREGQLASGAPFGFNTMVPGSRVKIGLLETIRDIQTEYRLSTVSVSVDDESEKIDLTLIVPGVDDLITEI